MNAFSIVSETHDCTRSASPHETRKENHRSYGTHLLQSSPRKPRRTLPRMHPIPRVCVHAFRQMSFSGEEKHLRQMPYPLLSPRHERKSQKSHAVFGTAHVGASPWISVASCVGWKKKTSQARKESFSGLDLGFGEEFLGVSHSYFVEHH